MDGSWACHERLGCGVILISRDWIRRLFPLFSGRWKNCPKFCQKFDGSLIRRLVVAERRNVGEYSYKRGIIALNSGEKYASLRLPIFEEPWRARWGYRADDRLLWSITELQLSGVIHVGLLRVFHRVGIDVKR